MEIDETTTAVVFRVWRDSGSVLALFPEVQEDRGFCSSYERVGQHGSADYTGCIGRTRPAKPNEYRALKTELESRGYRLRILSRRPPR